MATTEEVIKMLDSMVENEVSRMKINISDDVEAGQRKKEYHHGRCDVRSPYADGRLGNFEDGCK